MYFYTHTTMQWGRIDKVIDNWLKERQKVLILLCRLLKIHPFNDEHLESDVETLQTFSEILIDYVSAGHFGVFEKIAEASEYTNNSGLDRDLLVNILRTTIIAMDFSSKYEECTDYTEVKKDLSKLSKALVKRMDWEDELIHTYTNATSELAQGKEMRKTG